MDTTQENPIVTPNTDNTKDEIEPDGGVGGGEPDSIDDDNDGDPIPSGTGTVSKECSASELIGWSEILPKWHSKLNQRPKGLNPLVRNGVPEPLRGEVWQLLSGAHQCSDLMEQYRIYLTKSAPTEQIISRDVHRTYPAHENFRSDAGSDSLVDSLFKVCKAYAVYDEEVGYCQGLSFLVAALLLHMPEEQAFCVFVRIMQHYGLRDLFRNNFDELYLKFYQLERLLADNMPDLYQHFKTINIEPFQYASQWFLTVFTAKFPLNAVFYIMDVFLLSGIETIFQIALALLSASKQELLALDFEGVLKFFRVQMPKRYRNQEHVQQLILSASEMSLKKLKAYAKSYEAMKRKDKLLENPTMKLENAKLTEAIVRLENENDSLARDLIASKIQLRSQLDLLEDKTEILNRALTYSRQDCQSYLNTISDMEDERSRLEIEVSQLKEVCRRELQRAETELQRNGKIIEDYKKICSQLSRRLDYHKRCSEQFVEITQDLLRDNESCTDRTCLELFRSKADEFTENLKSDTVAIGEPDSSPSTSNCDSPLSADRKSLLQRKASSESDHNRRPVGAYVKSDSQSTSSELKIKQLTEHIDELEVELARTKLALVESECERQQLAHDTPTLQNNDKSASGLSNKFEFMRSAISSASSSMAASNRSKEVQISGSRGAGGALSRINNLISEKISNISQGQQQQQQPLPTTMPNSTSTPAFTNSGASWFGSKSNSSAITNNNRNLTNNNNTLGAKPIDENEHQC
uniref:Rab GTPase-activating protein 1 n=1 Tax=Aceria tosichella TaxID=561515 RepID=A0A6G1SK20_9ACAR